MPTELTRRAKLVAVAALALAPLAGCATAGAPAGSGSATATSTASPTAAVSAEAASSDRGGRTHREFKKLEREFDTRLGVYAVDTGTGRAVTYRADDRFAYASTHKVLSVGAVLRRNSIEEFNEKVITFTEDDLVTYSPVTERYACTPEREVCPGMTLREVSEAAVRYSDNTAANLLFGELGGPDGLEAALEEIGDDVTHVDRVETDLNEATPGDIRDTSTPRAMATSLRAFTLGEALPAEKRAILTDMLKGNTTGEELIRAGVVEGWEVGDKSGAGGYGTRNDIAIVWPPDDAPLVLAIMSRKGEEDAGYDNALIAKSAEVAVEALT
ncbi:class A beta-lactamase [Salinactinospora qingdaonensis]|uniref:Beta-lactamase n=1 Tax=Salinactinospora qingdaonensis TaxID=702744 RepID=A0ABP7GFX2_9ACTN